MSNSRKKILLNKVAAVNIGCSCRALKLSSIFSPKPKSKLPKYQNHFNLISNSSSSFTSGGTTSSSNATFSPYMDYHTSYNNNNSTAYPSPPVKIDGFGRRVGGGKTVAVEKDSSDPYLDFRQSMLQMIVENGISSKDDLKEMLNCFLQLNDVYLHGIIIRAFTEIWNSVCCDSDRGARRRSYDSPKVHVWPKSYEI